MTFTDNEKRVAEIVREDLKERLAEAMFPSIKLGFPDNIELTPEDIERRHQMALNAQAVQDLFAGLTCRFYWEPPFNG